jgi:hypothetical protein
MKRILAVALVMLAACSSSKPVATTTSTPPSVVTSTSPSTTATSTTATTLPNATTTSAPIVSTTTIAPPAAETRKQVETAFAESTNATTEVLRNHVDPAAIARFDAATTPDGSARKIVHDKLTQLTANGWEVRPNPAAPTTATMNDDLVLASNQPPTAEFSACDVDGDVVFKPGVGTGGGDAIINNAVTARLTRVTMAQVEGKWLLVKNVLVQEFKESTSCG